MTHSSADAAPLTKKQKSSKSRSSAASDSDANPPTFSSPSKKKRKLEDTDGQASTIGDDVEETVEENEAGAIGGEKELSKADKGKAKKRRKEEQRALVSPPVCGGGGVRSWEEY
jgi:hypothetical protein